MSRQGFFDSCYRVGSVGSYFRLRKLLTVAAGTAGPTAGPRASEGTAVRISCLAETLSEVTDRSSVLCPPQEQAFLTLFAGKE